MSAKVYVKYHVYRIFKTIEKYFKNELSAICVKFAFFSIFSTFSNILDNYSNSTDTQTLDNSISVYSN